MPFVPKFSDFVLKASIANVPAGEAGQLKRLDSHHVALLFDNYEDLVFDVNDTEPEVWAAIKKRVVRRPSCSYVAWAATILLALVIGWTIDPPLSVASAEHAIEYVAHHMVPD